MGRFMCEAMAACAVDPTLPIVIKNEPGEKPQAGPYLR